MFGKLKELASSGAAQAVVDKVAPELKDSLEQAISQVDGNVISDDDRFTQEVVPVVRTAIEVSAGGVTSLLPGFEEKFEIAMLHIRDELINTEGDVVGLVEGFEERLPEVLKSGLEKVK